MSTTAGFVLDTRRMKSLGKYPVKLRVTYKRVTKYFPTILDCHKDEYEKLSAPRINPLLQEVKEKLRTVQKNASEFIDEMDPFNFYEFERDFINGNNFFIPRKNLKVPEIAVAPGDFDFSPYYSRFPLFKEDHSRYGCISCTFLSRIKNMIQEERIGTALKNQGSYTLLKKFKGNVLFTDITVSFLYQFEKWMLNRDCSITTVGICLRDLRAAFNEAIDAGIIKREKCYPFGKRKYRIPTGRNTKKALPIDALGAIYYYEPECLQEAKAKDFWLFFYFANGINPKDVLYLKYKNIQDDYIVFTRAKTERATRENPKLITIYLTDDLKRVIEHWGNKDKNPNSFIFPIIDLSLNPLQRDDLVRAFTHFINDWMAIIGEKLCINRKITTIVSRHSFSTQLKRSGASIEFIQEALGHTDKKTTENYLDSFEKEMKKEYAGMLAPFKREGTSLP
jgi:integrase